MAATLKQMMQLLFEHNASDLHIVSGQPPTVRVNGELVPIQGEAVLTAETAHELVLQLLNEEQLAAFEKRKEIDLSYQFEDKARFRVNAYEQRNSTALSMRLIPNKIKTLDELRMPPIVHSFAQMYNGFVLVTGPTGSGKSSTLAAILEEINQTRAEHILTIEDPIEYVYTPAKSVISQREIGTDTTEWAVALRSALRQDPNIVLVGEMRDLETIAAALTVAETGHLVFATLHTNSGPETIDRIIDVFPAHQQGQIRQQLANSLRAVISQRLIPTADGTSRIAGIEVLMNTSAVANLIREGKTFQIDNVMQTSSETGMMLLEAHLAQLVSGGTITYEEARKYAIREADLARLLGR